MESLKEHKAYSRYSIRFLHMEALMQQCCFFKEVAPQQHKNIQIFKHGEIFYNMNILKRGNQ